MEPLTVLGVIANIAQFIDYVVRLFSEAKTIFRTNQSSASIATLDVSEASNQIAYLMEQIEDSAEKFEQMDTTRNPNAPTGFHTKTGHDGSIERDLLRRYRAIAVELDAILRDLKLKAGKTVGSRMFNSAQLAIKSYRRKDVIEGLNTRLVTLGKDVDSRNIWLLREYQQKMAQDIMEIRTTCVNASQDIGQIRRGIDDRVEQTAATIAALLRELLRATGIEETDRQQLNGAVHGRVLGSEPLAPDDVNAALFGFVTKAARLKWQSNVLMSLHFPAMSDRAQAVKHAEEHTLQWAFKESPLVSWLKEESGLFWLTGKAGSGKSTLMKHLRGSDKTLDILKEWAQGLPLILVSHYFWISGSPLQRSISGLYRSIIFQILSQHPVLFDNIQACKDRRTTARSWTIAELEETMGEIGVAATSMLRPEFKICIFIDGLDEYNDDEHHSDIVSAVENLSIYENIKILVSSRPWSEFENAFGNNREIGTIRMEDFTIPDMRTFTMLKFRRGSREFRELQKQDVDRANEIVDCISKRAEGVWIWLYLVVHDLVRDLQICEITIDDILHQIEQTPKDFDVYLQAQMERGEPRFREEAARVFLTVMTAGGSLPGLGVKILLEHIDNQERQISTALSSNRIFLKEVLTKIDYGRLRSQLNNRCKDLLDMSVRRGSKDFISESNPFDFPAVFMHRCVADYFRKTYATELRKRSEQISGCFDPKVFVLALEVMKLRCATHTDLDTGYTSISSKTTNLNTLRDSLKSSLDLCGKVDVELSSEISSFINTRSIGIGISAAEDYEHAFWSSFDERSLSPDLLQRVKSFHRLIDKIKSVVSTTLITTLELLQPNDTPQPIETMLFANLALTENLQTYIKRLVSTDKRILRDYPQLMFFALHPICAEDYYFSCPSQSAPSNTKLFNFVRYILGHPIELRNIIHLKDNARPPTWAPSRSGPDPQLIRFLLKSGNIDINKPLVNRINLPTFQNQNTVHKFDYPAGYLGAASEIYTSSDTQHGAEIGTSPPPWTLWTFFLSSILHYQSYLQSELNPAFSIELDEENQEWIDITPDSIHLDIAQMLVDEYQADGNAMLMHVDLITEAREMIGVREAIRRVWGRDAGFLLAQLEKRAPLNLEQAGQVLALCLLAALESGRVSRV